VREQSPIEDTVDIVTAAKWNLGLLAALLSKDKSICRALSLTGHGLHTEGLLPTRAAAIQSIAGDFFRNGDDTAGQVHTMPKNSWDAAHLVRFTVHWFWLLWMA